MTNAPALKTNGQADVQRTRQTTYTPRVDILETAEELLLFADLPGVRPEDLDLRFEQGELTLHGKVKPRHEGDLAKEYGTGDYWRVFRITEDLDADNFSASLKNGVLTLRLPKSAHLKPRKIEVRSA